MTDAARLNSSLQLQTSVRRAQSEPILSSYKELAITYFASYWKFFDEQEEARVVTRWRVGAKSRLADAVRGDILWLFTSGGKCRKKLAEDDLPDGGVEESLAYLTVVFTIGCVVPEIAGPFKLLVEGATDRFIGLCRGKKIVGLTIQEASSR